MIITTNIRLPEEQWKALKIMAVHAGTSVSALLRSAVEHILKASPGSSEKTGPKTLKGRRDPFYEAVGLGAGGPPDDSSRHDFYLYGKK